MSTTDIKLLSSLVNYVLDVKPYHTKLFDFSSELFFTDSFNATVTDASVLTLYHQNVWGRDDAGGDYLIRVCEGTDADRTFRIPAAIFPRFSLNDGVPIQSPLGDDPASQSLTDANSDGVPDAEQPWTGARSSSHFTGADTIEVPVPILYVVPEITVYSQVSDVYTITYNLTAHANLDLAAFFGFGSGFNIYVNGARWTGAYSHISNTFTVVNLTANLTATSADYAALGIDPAFVAGHEAFVAQWLLSSQVNPTLNASWTATGRYAVPFHQGSRVRVNNVVQPFSDNYIVDESRGWIQFTAGNFPAPTDLIDVNLMKVDRLFISYMSPFTFGDWFEITIDSTAPRGYTIVFNNSQPGQVKPSLEVLSVGSGAADGDQWYIEARGSYTFKVQRIVPLVDNKSDLVFKQVYDDGDIRFVIDRTWSSYYFTDDPNSYPALASDWYDVYTFDGAIDTTDYQVGLDLVTEHGVVSDPIPPRHAPVQLLPFGQIKKVTETTSVGLTGDYYVFELFGIPPRGAYIELRIEQNGQLNPWLNATITDEVRFTELLSFAEISSGDEDYDDPPFDDDPFDGGAFDIVIDDDMYLALTEIDTSTTTLIHNVDLLAPLVSYAEPRNVNQLILHHGRGYPPAAVAVTHAGNPITPDSLSTDNQRVIIGMNTGQTLGVTLTFIPVVPDPYFTSVVMLCHFDGASGSTTFTNSCPRGTTIFNGVPSHSFVSTATPEFGTGALSVDGSGFYPSSPSAPDYTFGTGDFTIEASFNTAVPSQGANLIDFRTGPGTVSPILYMSGGTFGLYSVSAPLITGGAVLTSTWQRVAVSRVSGVSYLFVDGVLIGSASDTNNYVQGPISFGGTSFVSSAPYNGLMDEVRVTVGVGRYTASYTPSATAFPNS